MPADDNLPRPDAPAGTPAAPSLTPEAAPARSGRRRRTRSWSTPPAPSVESFDRPLTERDWNRSPAGSTATPAAPTTPAPPITPAAPPAPGRLPIAAPPPITTPTSPPAAPGPDLVAALAEVRAEVAGLREELAAMARSASTADATRITGPELAASIEALGTTLGTGLAALLTEHRSLLARDVEAAADRVLDELGERLRSASSQTVDGVEERVRHISARGFGDLSAHVDLRLDHVESDVSGLRAVMLEIPDQTTIVERLDQLLGGTTPPRRVTALRPADAPDLTWEADEPVAPVAPPSARAGKAPLRAKAVPKPAPKPAAKRTASIESNPQDEAPEAAPAPKPKARAARAARAPRAPRTARAAGISADAETTDDPKRATRRAKR